MRARNVLSGCSEGSRQQQTAAAGSSEQQAAADHRRPLPLLTTAAAADHRDLASQVRRALGSVALNLAEGFGAAAGNARLRFESARAAAEHPEGCRSLYESQAGLRVAVAWGYLAPAEVAPALAALDHLGGRIFGLIRG